jgi:hypothetical protein
VVLSRRRYRFGGAEVSGRDGIDLGLLTRASPPELQLRLAATRLDANMLRCALRSSRITRWFISYA